MARTEDTEKSGRLIYVIRLRAERDDAAIRGLRWLLKTALQSFGLRCVGMTVELAEKNEARVIPSMQAANR
jgi:hypothetical protein